MKLPGLFFGAAVLIAFVACGTQGLSPSAAGQLSGLAQDGRVVSATSTASVLVTPGDPVPLDRLTSAIAVPQEIRMRPGEVQRLSARGFGKIGQELTGLKFRWEMIDRIAGSIDLTDATGTTANFTASRHIEDYGDALRLVATQEADGVVHTVSSLVPVVIVPGEEEQRIVFVESIGGEVQGVTGQLIRLQAVAYDALGRIIPRARLSWEVGDQRVGQVLASNFLEVRATPGSYPEALRVTASLGDTSVESSVGLQVLDDGALSERISAFVLPTNLFVVPGGEYVFDAIVVDGAGSVVSTEAGSWSLAIPEAGVIDQNGRFRGGPSEGTFRESVIYTVKAGDKTVDARATVTVKAVTPRVLNSVVVRPDAALVSGGGTTLFSLSAQDDQGRAVPGLETVWKLETESIGSINENGLFTASAATGFFPRAVSATVTQELGGGFVELKAFADVTIPGALSKVVITPSQAEIGAGESTFFRATPLDENGIRIPGVLIEWSVDESTAGSIDAAGVFRAGEEPGNYSNAIQAKASQRISEELSSAVP